MKSVGVVAVVHAMVVSKWNYLLPVQFQTHSFVVDSFFQLRAAII